MRAQGQRRGSARIAGCHFAVGRQASVPTAIGLDLLSRRYAQRVDLGVEEGALYPKAADPADEADRLVAGSGFDEDGVAPGDRPDARVVAPDHPGDL